MADFDSMLNVDLDSVQRPKPLPQGNFKWKVLDYDFGESSNKGTPYVRYDLQFAEAGEDVDEDLLEEVPNYQQKTMSEYFYLSETTMWRLKDFLQAAGVETQGRTIKEALDDAIGAEVWAFIRVRSAQNSDAQFNEISNFAEA